MRSNSFGYVFGFNFADALAFWRFAFSVLRGQILFPIRPWMFLWAIACIGLQVLGIGVFLFLVSTSNH